MKFYVVQKKQSFENMAQYVGNCNIKLIIFKQILRSNINPIKLKSRVDALYVQPNISWKVKKEDINVVDICNLYIANLTCQYDKKLNQCYYAINKHLKCKYAITPIEDIIRCIEYGGEHMRPLGWLMESYQEFKEITKNKENK